MIGSSRSGVHGILAACAMTAFGSSAMGQAAGRVWVPFNGAAAGTPTSVVVDRGASNEDRTVFNVSLSGYFAEQIIVPGEGTFSKISLPEDEEAVVRSAGRPAMPTLGMLLGIPTDAPGLGTPIVTVIESQVVNNVLVYPFQPEEIEEPGNFPLTPFTQDDAAYLSRATYPSALAEVGGPASEFSGLKIQGVSIHPFRYVPSLERMTINTRFRVEVPHVGNAIPAVPMSRRTALALDNVLDNWTLMSEFVAPNLVKYEGCYLIITPQRYLEELQPLVDQKSERGLRVTILTTEDIGNTPLQIKNAIRTFDLGCNGDDQYVLLVGDTNDIPLTTDPVNGNPSDHEYACTNPGFFPDVWLGRLSVDSEADLTAQLAKILAYQDAPVSSAYYDNVELIAHRQVSKGYVDCMQQVAAASGYTPQPQFTGRYGTSTNGTNANVITDIEAGQHIVMYRGHGSSTAWTGWDFNSADFTTANVVSVDNAPRPSIVLHVACTNSAIDLQNDCFAEEWMENGPDGAVASYGATRGTGTGRNHVFARKFFKILYNGSPQFMAQTTNLAWAQAFAELGADAEVEGNWYKYLLLGDPEMKVYTSNPSPIFISGFPNVVLPRPTELVLRALSPTGGPIPNAIIAVKKGNEVLDNRYTAGDGSVRIMIDPLTEGDLTIRAYTEFDSRSAARAVVPVRGCRSDINGDGGVDGDDVIEFFDQWDAGDIAADFNGDGGVDGDDVIAFFARWDIGC